MCSTVNCEHARTFPNAGMHRVDPALETYELELARNGNMKTTNTNHPFHKSPLPHHMRRHGIQAGVRVRVRAGRKMMGRIRGELVSVGMEGQTAFLDSRMHDMGPPLHTVERGRAFFHFSIAWVCSRCRRYYLYYPTPRRLVYLMQGYAARSLATPGSLRLLFTLLSLPCVACFCGVCVQLLFFFATVFRPLMIL